MRNDYTPLYRKKKVAKTVPIQKRIQIQKPIVMLPVAIVQPFFVL